MVGWPSGPCGRQGPIRAGGVMPCLLSMSWIFTINAKKYNENKCNLQHGQIRFQYLHKYIMFPIRARGVMPCLPCMAACLTEGQSTQGGEDRWRGRGVEGHWGLASTTERHTNEPCGVGAGEHDAKQSTGFSLAGYNQPFGQCSPARVPCVSVVKSPWPVLADGVEARETPGQISLLDREAGADPATSIYHPPLLACIHQI